MPGSAPAWDAIVLAGGRGSRLGGVDKGALVLDGRTLLARLLPELRAAGRVVVVGDPALGADGLAGQVVVVREDPPHGGPVAGTAAGLDALDSPGALGGPPPPAVALIAVDMPHAAEALPLLLADWGETADGVVAVDSAGRRQPLLAVYRAGRLRDAVTGLVRNRGGVEGSSMRQLLAPLDLREVRVPDSLAADVDTPADAARLGIDVPTATQSAQRQTHDREGPHR